MSRYFAIEEYHDRWRKVQESMKKKGYDYALIWGKTGGPTNALATSCI